MSTMVATLAQRTVKTHSVTGLQPAALASHFFFEKDERKLRARDVSLDSLTYSSRGGEYEY
ncbi:hypothetical protein V8061_001037 [Vibrio parahaemolyticus]